MIAKGLTTVVALILLGSSGNSSIARIPNFRANAHTLRQIAQATLTTFFAQVNLNTTKLIASALVKQKH